MCYNWEFLSSGRMLNWIPKRLSIIPTVLMESKLLLFSWAQLLVPAGMLHLSTQSRKHKWNTPSVPLVRERPLAPHDCTIEGQHHRSLGQNRRKPGFAGCVVCCSPCSVTVPSLHLGPEPSWLREGRFGDLAQLRRWPAKPATSPCTSASSSLKWELWPL